MWPSGERKLLYRGPLEPGLVSLQPMLRGSPHKEVPPGIGTSESSCCLWGMPLPREFRVLKMATAVRKRGLWHTGASFGCTVAHVTASACEETFVLCHRHGFPCTRLSALQGDRCSQTAFSCRHPDCCPSEQVQAALRCSVHVEL